MMYLKLHALPKNASKIYVEYDFLCKELELSGRSKFGYFYVDKSKSLVHGLETELMKSSQLRKYSGKVKFEVKLTVLKIFDFDGMEISGTQWSEYFDEFHGCKEIEERVELLTNKLNTFIECNAKNVCEPQRKRQKVNGAQIIKQEPQDVSEQFQAKDF